MKWGPSFTSKYQCQYVSGQDFSEDSCCVDALAFEMEPYCFAEVSFQYLAQEMVLPHPPKVGVYKQASATEPCLF